jgi:hypothetical protein
MQRCRAGITTTPLIKEIDKSEFSLNFHYRNLLLKADNRRAWYWFPFDGGLWKHERTPRLITAVTSSGRLGRRCSVRVTIDTFIIPTETFRIPLSLIVLDHHQPKRHSFSA